MYGVIKLNLYSGSKKCELKQLRQNCSYYSYGQLQRMEKSKKGDQDRWSLGQDLHPRQPEYEAVFLLTGQQSSIY